MKKTIMCCLAAFLVACGGGSTPSASSGGTGGSGGDPSVCYHGTECESQCCWANVCAYVGEDAKICPDHGITPDQCGKCTSDGLPPGGIK